MSQTDPIADMLTRVRNANKALHAQVEMPASGLKIELARLLQDEGYIESFAVRGEGAKPELEIFADDVVCGHGSGEEDQQAGPPRLRQEGQPPQSPGRSGDGRYLYVAWTHDGSRGSTTRSGRRSRLLRLVAPCRE